MNRRDLLTLIFCFVGIALIVTGILNGQAMKVLKAATRICMECIGIG